MAAWMGQLINIDDPDLLKTDDLLCLAGPRARVR